MEKVMMVRDSSERHAYGYKMSKVMVDILNPKQQDIQAKTMMRLAARKAREPAAGAQDHPNGV